MRNFNFYYTFQSYYLANIWNHVKLYGHVQFDVAKTLQSYDIFKSQIQNVMYSEKTIRTEATTN